MYTVVRSKDYDWIGLYHDGVLLHEGHSIQEEDLLRLLGVDFNHRVEDFEKLGGRCPFYERDLEA